MPQFTPSYGPIEQRLRQLESWASLQGNSPINAAQAANAVILGGGAAASAGESLIPEAEVVFDPTAGHAHDGSDSHTIALAGDVTGTNTAAVVAKIEGVPIAAPTSGEDKKAVYYNHGSVAWGYSAFTTLTLLGAWGHASCATLVALDAELMNAFSVTGARTIANPMPLAGTLKALVLKLSGDVGAAGNDVIVTVYKNGSATALTATITGGAGTEDEAITSNGTVTFAAGDDITVEAKANGVPGAVQMVATVWGTFTG